MSNVTSSEFETSSNSDNQGGNDGNKQQQQIPRIDEKNEEAIFQIPMMEGLQKQLSASNLSTTSGTVNIFVSKAYLWFGLFQVSEKIR